jgi:hypothetical protein
MRPDEGVDMDVVGAMFSQDGQDGQDQQPPEPEEPRYHFTPGGSFILDTDSTPRALWGEGDQVFWADGEALMISSRQGLGKTTLAQQLALGWGGFDRYAQLLGYPIEEGRRVLYLAMDRPRQIARSFRRMVDEDQRAQLDERLIVWQGPPPGDLAKYPSLLLHLCHKADADAVIVDSLKDAAIGLSDDEVGAGYNRARQAALVAGVQVAELHHPRKAPDSRHAEITLDDLYGSTWLTSGAGSVILLTGKAGDPIVGLRHLKQPSAEVGPFRVLHNWDTGRSTVWEGVDLVPLAAQPGGLSVAAAARALFDTDKPSPAEKEKARRRLESLTDKGLLFVFDPGDQATNRPRIWTVK